MPGESLLSGKGWKDLPSGLQIHILSFLFEYPEERRPQPIKIFLDFAQNITTILPRDILNVAEASPDLCDLVKEMLGSRAQYLTENITGDLLHIWVSILGTRVKAVSAWDVHLDVKVQRSRQKDELEDFLVIKRDSAFKLFRSLQEGANLLVLDLKDVPLYYCGDAEERLLNSLVGALQQSSESLKELALPVAELSSMALERVSFSNLEIVELELRIWGGHEDITSIEDERASEVFMQMLRSLKGHAPGSRKVTTIHELRLLGVRNAPCIENTQSNFPNWLFDAVTTLRLECHRSSRFLQSDYGAMFISFFPNLERVHWNCAVTQEHLEVIDNACSNMQELHLHPPTIYDDWNFDFLEAMLLASQEKMRKLVLRGTPTVEVLKKIGELCPGLRHLGLEITRNNVGGLASLLSSLPHIRNLNLVVGDEETRFPVEDWAVLIDAVRSGSDALSDVELIVEEAECDLELIVQPFIEVVAVLSERGREVCLTARRSEPELRQLVDVSSDILRACIAHTKQLECLNVWFIVQSVLITESEEQEKELARRFLQERRNLLETATQLHTACIEPLDMRGRPMRSDQLTRTFYERNRPE